VQKGICPTLDRAIRAHLLIMIISIPIEEFDPDLFEASTKHRLYLELTATTDGERLAIPALLVNGRNPGKTLLAIAGVHGDEFAGIQAIHEVCHQLDPEQMSGRMLAIPVANPSAYWAGTRHTPADGLNLARTFPGRKDGSLTERLAYHLSEEIIARSDFLIDLHTGGIRYKFPPLVGYDGSDSEQGKQSQQAAQVFGTPVLWGHPHIPTGRTISEAAHRAIPWLYCESSDGKRASSYYTWGLLNLLKYLGIIPGAIEVRRARFDLVGEGDIDSAIQARTSGLFAPNVQLLDRVKPGEAIATVRDLHGEVLEEIRAEQEGYVVMLRALPVVHSGESVCLIAQSAQRSRTRNFIPG
jgi:predicted deacylase